MGSIELIIEARRRSIGTGDVERLLPYRSRRMVGPFIYLDLIGPDRLEAGTGLDVPPHPHIGLATVTYLTSGALVHRDSTGAVQRIEPGDINWMHAGNGVVHSERTPDDHRPVDVEIAGAQIWVALPDAAEDSAPFFEHHPVATLPTFDTGDGQTRLLAGAAYQHHAPPTTTSPLFLASTTFANAGSAPLPDAHAKRAVVVLSGEVAIDGEAVPARSMAVLGSAATTIDAAGPAHVLQLGGSPVGHRKIWWNFVGSNQERIDDAKQRWRDDRFAPVPDETERVPLPSGLG